jgi:hypothetical protein
MNNVLKKYAFQNEKKIPEYKKIFTKQTAVKKVFLPNI